MFGLEHLGNCHGEVSMLVSFLVSLPLIGAWIRSRRAKKHKFDHIKF